MHWEAMFAVRQLVQQGRHADGLKACLELLRGRGPACGDAQLLDQMEQVVGSWAETERLHVLRHDNEFQALNSKLNGLREKSEELKRVKENHARELTTARRLQQQAEERVRNLQAELRCSEGDCGMLQRENNRLRQQLSEHSRRQRQPPTREEVVRQMAELECGPLRRCSDSERQQFKKKLLLKWHPDKQPSTQHSDLATQIMQELQNRPEWSRE